MALQSHLDGFNINTDSLTRTGFGFEPKAWINWGSGQTSTTSAIGLSSAQDFFGVGVSTALRASIGSQSTHNVSPSQESRGMRDDADIFTLANVSTNTVDGLGDISSVDSDGLTRVADDGFATDVRVNSMSWGGDDITDVAVVGFNMQGATGDQDITDVGFDISTGGVIFFLGTGSGSDPPSAEAVSCLILGVAAVNPDGEIQQFVMENRGIDNQATSRSQGYLRTGECLSSMGSTASTAIVVRASVTAMLSNGFRINIAETNTAQRRVRALVIKGGRWWLDSMTMPGNTTPFDVTDIPFEPKGGLLFTRFRAQEASDTGTVDFTWGVGGFNFQGASIAQQAHCVYENDSANPSVVTTGMRTDRCYIRPDETSGAAVALGRVTALNSDGFTFETDDADPDSTSFVPYLVWGDEAGAGDDTRVRDVIGRGVFAFAR